MKKYDSKSADKSRKNRSILPVIITLCVIFVVLLGGVFYLRFKNNFHFKNISISKISLDDSLKRQLESQKGEKQVQIRLTDNDLSKILNTNTADFPLKNSAVKINSSEIILTGKTGNSPLSFKVEVGIIPRVNNGKIDFDIREIKTAGVSAPKLVTDRVNTQLTSYLKQMVLQDDITVTDVKMYDGYLIATGERTN